MQDWVVLELGPRADGEDPEVIRRSIRKILKNAEVFVPALVTMVGGDKSTRYLIEGYAFIRHTFPDQVYRKLEGTAYVVGALGQRNANGKISTVADVEVEKLKSRMVAEADQGIEVGDTVVVTSGPYRAIPATVIEDIPEREEVQVYIKMYSKEAILSFPRSFLRLIAKSAYNEYIPTIKKHQKWVGMSKVLLDYPTDNILPLADRFGKWRTKSVFLDRLEILNLYLGRGPETNPVISKFERWLNFDKKLTEAISLKPFVLPEATEHFCMQSRLDRLVYLTHYRDRLLSSMGSLGDALYHNHVVVDVKPPSYDRFIRLEILHQKIVNVAKECYAIKAHKVALESSVVHTILVDGHNLALRCFYAPGMADLKNSSGTPTGMILGFIRSLLALKKRYPEAGIIVCWDGSSQRRKKVFAGYKANRKERKSNGFDQIAYLKELLPFFGIRQAWNPEEEADDVIATLVEQLKNIRKVIYSTDRDLLQLVDVLTIVQSPAVGGAKERFFDLDEVVVEYEVDAEKLVHLRAFLGDSSDAIPGVPQVPTKILTALVRSYKTVDGVYASGMSGVPALQCQRIRDAEAKIRMNLGLMSLHRDVVVTVVEPAPNQDTAIARLTEMEMKTDQIKPFFEKGKGFLKEAI